MKLTKGKSLDMFYNALCNGLGYVCSGYCLRIDYKDKEYEKARAKLKGPSFEDVLIQILKDGNQITLIDVEYDGEYTKSICLEDVYDRVQNAPLRNLTNYMNERDDAIDADCLIQSVFYNEIIFG